MTPHSESPDSSSFRVDAEAQAAFAWLSGDHNPIHVDPVEARRLLFGEPIVHGVHTALRMLEALERERPGSLRSTSALRLRFLRPLRLGERVSVTWRERGPAEYELHAVVGGELVCNLHLELDPDLPVPELAPRRVHAPRSRPREWDQDHLPRARGIVPLLLDPERAAHLLPHVCGALPAQRLACLLAASRLVGMECPGRDSLFSELELAFGRAPVTDEGGLSYRAQAYDPRFRRLELSLKGPGLEGLVRCFVRPRVCRQASVTELVRRGVVRPREFAGWNALVVGGSRGLGEVAAKLIGIGGGRTWIGYVHGHADAARVRDELLEHGAEAEAVAFDVLALEESLSRLPAAAELGELLYFAAPPIQPGNPKCFSRERFLGYCAYFVDGFATTVAALRERHPTLSRILYPSSAYVEAPPPGMAEYAAAKAAGESLCRWMRGRGLELHSVRLERLATDQTRSLLNPDAADPVPPLLSVLRSMQVGTP